MSAAGARVRELLSAAAPSMLKLLGTLTDFDPTDKALV